jgi:hypothetical protein
MANQRFENPNDPDNSQIRAALARWLAESGYVGTLEVVENVCTDPGCLHTETVLILENSDMPIQYFKIAKPLVYIRKWDIAALKALTTPPTVHRH